MEVHTRAWHDMIVIQRLVLSFLGPLDVVRLSSLNKSFYLSAMHSQCLDLADIDDESSYAKLAPFYRHAHELRLHRSFALPACLFHLMKFHSLQQVSLHDVVCLADDHLASLTSHAPQLRHLHVEGSHGLADPQLKLPVIETLVFRYNLMLRSLSFPPTQSLTEVAVTACPSFVEFDALLAAAPRLQSINFSQSNALVRFQCIHHPELHTLLLDRCAQLSFLELQVPALKLLNVQLCGHLQQAVVCASQLQSVSFSMLTSLVVLYLDCPRLTRLNLTGSTALSPSGMTLECPLLKQVQCDGTALRDVVL
ncbi:unnamed protein product [Aphanomyces euteiches]